MTAATRLEFDPIPISTEPFIRHSGADASGDPGPSNRSFPLQNPSTNMFHILFPKSQRRRVPDHVDIPRHVDIPLHVDINNQRQQDPEVIVISSPTKHDVTRVTTPPISTTRQMQAYPTDPLSVIMEELREMREKINGIPGVPPPLDVASQTCYADSPFRRHITDVEISRKFVAPSMILFDGTTDPLEHVAQYKQQMLATSVRPEQWEACMCRAFGTTLTGPALTWFVNLPNEGVSSFAELVNLFNQQFASSRVLEKQTSDLYRVV
ncbi:unnamed protein product [Cuscuta europaea]|uniref:Retrotransposon gag domain-containing protein n=1 Tax=Cuscuta europaea TaxID=41803 RepID=A0A9P0YU89_CUSEU|nr:unnamed protein product [Cuscuta europaea]